MQEGTLDFEPQDGNLAKDASLVSLVEQLPSIPGYQLERRIGEGTFGHVWAATQLSTGQKVAIKILQRTDLGAISYLEREVSRLANVTEHPNLLTLIDANLVHVPAFLVTPLLAGSLEQYVGQPLPLAQVVGWMRDVAVALAFIHGRGILHCDLKPSNLLLDQERRIRLVDFGQAHLLKQGGTSLGTLWFMPAEQVPVAGRNPHPEVTWDIYAYGATFYSLLTGRTARQNPEGDRAIASLEDPRGQLEEYRRQLRSTPLQPIRQLNSEVDRDLAAIIEHCLEDSPESRYASASEILAELDRRQRRYPIRARPQRPAYVTRRFLARNWILWLTVIMVLIALQASLRETNYYRALAGTYQARAEVNQALVLAQDGSLQPLLRMARACALSPHDWETRLCLSAYLRTQWVFLQQFNSNGGQALLTPDGLYTVIANSGSNGQVQIYSNQTGELARSLDHSQRVHRMSLSADGRWLICAIVDGRITRWDVSSGLGSTVARHNQAVTWAVLDQAGNHCLSGGIDGTVHWTRCGSAAPTLQWRHSGAISSLVLSQDGRWVASGSQDGLVQVWDLRKGGRVSSWMHDSPVRDLVWSKQPPGVLVGCSGGQIARHNLGGEPVPNWLHGRSLEGLKRTAQGSLLSWGGGLCRLWDSDGKLLQQFSQSAVFTSCDLSPAGTELLTGSEDGLAQVWDVSTGYPAYTAVARPGRLSEVGYFPQGNRLFTVGSAVDIWDLQGVERLPERLLHPGMVEDFAWHPQADWLVSVAGSRLYFWTSSGQPWRQPVTLDWNSPRVSVNSQGKLLCRQGSALRSYAVATEGEPKLEHQWTLQPNLQVSRNGAWMCSPTEVVPLGNEGTTWSLDSRKASAGLPADDGQRVALVVGAENEVELSLWSQRGKLASVTSQRPLLLRFVGQRLLCVTPQASTLYDAELHPVWSQPAPANPPSSGGVAVPVPPGWSGADCPDSADSLVAFNMVQAQWMDLATGKVGRLIPAVGRLGEGRLSQDGKWLCLSGTQGAYLYRDAGGPVAVPFLEHFNHGSLQFTPGFPQVALAKDRQIRLYSLGFDADSSPEQLNLKAQAQAGRILQGDVEYALQTSFLKTLRQALRAGGGGQHREVQGNPQF